LASQQLDQMHLPRSLPLFIVEKNFLSLLVLHIERKKKLLVVIAHARRCIALVDDAKKKI
jgi:hypothetical protein